MALALILAAGRGERLGFDSPKALVGLAGRPLVNWSVSTLRDVGGIDRIVVAMPSEDAPGKRQGTFIEGSSPVVVLVAGGETRSESVRMALAAAGPGDPVLVHDAARPLLTVELVRRTLAALAEDDSLDAAIAAVPVADTIKRVGDDGVVSETLDRSALWAVQTPQVFRRSALERALDVPAEVLAQATDDAWLVERLGGRVAVVPADGENLKITTPLDLALAELLIARRPD
ncbi:MAG TPA: 2-C-methyl-D-erythritol 4-phosphate cytidylyltransferase [Solirubrobacteraceae bacterium]|nr:2-C-methyl-D-erythritol 4-phosphate cytidylyltransferase [Solirubrobacteraceae bacterium]